MALKKESLAKLLVRLKIAADDAAAKELINKAEEVDVTVPDTVQFFTKEEIDTRDRTKYDAGVKAGAGKMLDDDLYAANEIKVTGKKEIADFLNKFREKVLAEANISVDEKVKEKDKIIGTLRENIKKLETDHAGALKSIREKELDGELLMWTIDKKPDNLTNQEWVGLLKMNNELVEENGQLFVKRGGTMVVDQKLQTNVPAKDAVLSFIEERKLGKVVAAPPVGGRGAGDSKTATGGIRTMSQFNQWATDNKVDPKGAQAQAELARITKDVADFDFKS